MGTPRPNLTNKFGRPPKRATPRVARIKGKTNRAHMVEGSTDNKKVGGARGRNPERNTKGNIVIITIGGRETAGNRTGTKTAGRKRQ